jgi:ABC-type branched-subunit amino acid transport system substrate-binding protein
VVGVVCCWYSASTIATLPAIEELKIPTTTGVAYLPDAKETKLTYLFKFGHTPRLEARFVDYWVNKLNIKKVFFLTRDDAWGHAMSGAYEARLKELGGTVLSSDFHGPDVSTPTSPRSSISIPRASASWTSQSPPPRKSKRLRTWI